MSRQSINGPLAPGAGSEAWPLERAGRGQGRHVHTRAHTALGSGGRGAHVHLKH